MACPCCVPCFDVHACPGQPYIFPSPGTPCPSGCTCSQCCNTCKPKQSINVDIQGDDPSSHLNGTYVLNLLTWQCNNSDLWYYFDGGIQHTLDCTSRVGFPRVFNIGPRITVRSRHPFYAYPAFSVESTASPAALDASIDRCCFFPSNCGLGVSDGPGFKDMFPAPSDLFCEGSSFDRTFRPRWLNYSGTVRIYY